MQFIEMFFVMLVLLYVMLFFTDIGHMVLINLYCLLESNKFVFVLLLFFVVKEFVLKIYIRVFVDYLHMRKILNVNP